MQSTITFFLISVFQFTWIITFPYIMVIFCNLLI